MLEEDDDFIFWIILERFIFVSGDVMGWDYDK